MRTLVFQHTPDEKLGSLKTWLKRAGFPLHVHHLYKGEAFPDPRQHDWLVVLGGPMNVDQEEQHPWLKREKDFLRDWVREEKPVLGICLGGQLLAQTLGGRVTKSAQREIGFHPVTRTGTDHPAFRRWPMHFPVFQWHEDRFTLPAGCHSLLTSEACEHQAFARDHRTVGLQFHPEAVEDWIHGNLEGFEPEPHENFVQTRHQCLQLMPLLLPPLTEQFFHFLEDFVANARPR